MRPVVEGQPLLPEPGVHAPAGRLERRLSTRIGGGGSGGGAAAALEVSAETRLSLLRRVAFFRQMEMGVDSLRAVASWVEVQHFERFRVMAEAGNPTHSLFVLASGSAEAFEGGRWRRRRRRRR